MPCRFASSGTVAASRSASRAILALNVASNFLRDLVIAVLHRLRHSRTLHTLTFGPISGVHFIPLGCLRLYSHQTNSNLKFKGLNYRHFGRKLQIDVDEAIKEVFDHSNLHKGHEQAK